MPYVDGCLVCTADDPWHPDVCESAQHPDARLVYSIDYGFDLIAQVYVCPHCWLVYEAEQVG